MNMFRMGLVMMTVAVGSMLASDGPSKYTRENLSKLFNKNLPTWEGTSANTAKVARFLGRNYLTSEINKNFKHPFAKAAVQTTGKIIEATIANEGFVSFERNVYTHAPYFAINGALRTAVEAGADRGYNVKNIGNIVPNCWLKEKAKEAVALAPEFTEETAYDAATSASIFGGYYLVTYGKMAALMLAARFSSKK